MEPWRKGWEKGMRPLTPPVNPPPPQLSLTVTEYDQHTIQLTLSSKAKFTQKSQLPDAIY